MAEEKYINLPKVKGIAATKAGIWLNVKDNFLESLYKGLDIANAKNMNSIDSIPDVWAKPILFKMSLFGIDSDMTDSGNNGKFDSLYKHAVGEWRSILAMLALSEIRNINLSTQYIDLQNDSSDLALILKKLKPKDSINGDKDAWEKEIYIIKYNGMPIAMTSPATLVSTTADYLDSFNGSIPLPWSDNGETFTDPIVHLLPEELYALKNWLGDVAENNQSQDSIRNRINTLTANAQDKKNIIKAIDDYVSDIKMALSRYDTSNIVMPVIKESDRLNLYRFNNHLLNYVIEAPKATAETSDVQLMTNPSRSSQKVLLISPELIQSFSIKENVNPSQVEIWQGINGSDILNGNWQGGGNGQSSINLIDRQIELEEAVFYTPDDFFYDKIAVVEPRNAFPNSLDKNIDGMNTFFKDGTTPILPIKPKLLHFFTPQEIAEGMSIDKDRMGNISISFKFPLRGRNNKNGIVSKSTYKYTKTYMSKNKDVIDIFAKPVIEIWPDIYLENWNKYYKESNRGDK